MSAAARGGGGEEPRVRVQRGRLRRAFGRLLLRGAARGELLLARDEAAEVEDTAETGPALSSPYCIARSPSPRVASLPLDAASVAAACSSAWRLAATRAASRARAAFLGARRRALTSSGRGRWSSPSRRASSGCARFSAGLPRSQLRGRRRGLAPDPGSARWAARPRARPRPWCLPRTSRARVGRGTGAACKSRCARDSCAQKNTNESRRATEKFLFGDVSRRVRDDAGSETVPRHRMFRSTIARRAPRSPNTALPVPSPRTASVPARAPRSTPPFFRSLRAQTLRRARCPAPAAAGSSRSSRPSPAFARRGASRRRGQAFRVARARATTGTRARGRVGREPATARVASGRRRASSARGDERPRAATRPPGTRRAQTSPSAMTGDRRRGRGRAGVRAACFARETREDRDPRRAAVRAHARRGRKNASRGSRARLSAAAALPLARLACGARRSYCFVVPRASRRAPRRTRSWTRRGTTRSRRSARRDGFGMHRVHDAVRG